MTTTEPTTEQQVPAWLNVDELIPADQRERIAALADTFENYRLEMEEEVNHALELLRLVSRRNSEESERVALAVGGRVDLGDLIHGLTGHDRLWTAMRNLSDYVDPEVRLNFPEDDDERTIDRLAEAIAWERSQHEQVED